MNVEYLREFCLKKPGVEESFPFDESTLVFKVMGKIFLIIGLEKADRFNVKCDPENAIALREQYDSVQPGYHMNKKHWNTIHMDGSVNDELLEQWITDSYDLITASLPAKLRRELESLT